MTSDDWLVMECHQLYKPPLDAEKGQMFIEQSLGSHRAYVTQVFTLLGSSPYTCSPV